MLETLRKILEKGVQDALDAQVTYYNQSQIFAGKLQGFKEVLMILDRLEEDVSGSQNSTTEEKKTA